LRVQVEFVKYSVEINISWEPFRQALLMGSEDEHNGLAISSPSAGDRPSNKTHDQIAAVFHSATSRASAASSTA
jgi:hypothetical protein